MGRLYNRTHQLKEKVIWITGAGSGIGKAIAEQLADKHTVLILSGRNEDKLHTIKDQLSPLCKQILVEPLDVTNQEAINQSTKKIIDQFSHIDILVNNAGISQRSLVSETSNEVGRQLMEVNFFGTIHLTKAVLPYLSADAEIVVMSSAAGKFGFTRRAYYSAAKHALHGFFDSLRAELKDTNINILMVCPGRINTDISKNALNGDGTAFAKNDHRLQKGMSAEECARIIKKAIKKRKKEIYLGGQEVILIYIKRFFPALYRYIVRKVKAN